MNRDTFHKLFKCPGPVVLPVIHVVDTEQVDRNVRHVIQAGAQGVFLINHDFDVEHFLPIIRQTRETHPALWLGVNFLAVTGEHAFPVLGELSAMGCEVDAYWADDARIDEHALADAQHEAKHIATVREESGWQGLYLGGTCFKKQREVAPEHYGTAANLACHYMDAVCTSGVATGKRADLDKIATFRQAIGNRVLALASGITPENAHEYADVDCFMVATGVSPEGDFYNLDPAKLNALLEVSRSIGASHDQH